MTDFNAMFTAQPLAAAEDVLEDGETGRRIADADAIPFMTSGKAFFTLRSKRTNTRFTYKVERAKDKDTMFFVSVLTGPDNWANYSYIGLIFTDKAPSKFVLGRPEKIKIGVDAPSVRAFVWAFERFQFGFGHAQLELWHAGRCGRCGLMLTVPESIASGYGPECIKKM